MEITDKMVEDAVKCATCGDCSMKCDTMSYAIRALATALQSERAKPKVWDKAPAWATHLMITATNDKGLVDWMNLYRTLPKTRAREIAEQVYDNLHSYTKHKELDISEIESAILKREAELKESTK